MRLVLIGLLIFFSGVVKSQTFTAHLLGGVASSQVSGDQLDGFNKAGVIAGAGVNASLSQKTALGFEIYYIQKGSRKRINVDKGDLEYYRLRLNYIEVPLLFTYMASNKLSLVLGPSLGTLIGSSEEDENGALEGRKEFIKYDAGISGGFAYHFSHHWGLHLRGGQSIAPIRTHSGGTVYRLNRGQYNSVLLFALYYRFGRDKND